MPDKMPEPRIKMERHFIATTGLNYVSENDGVDVRVEADEEVFGMSQSSLENELIAGNIVEVASVASQEKEVKK